MDSGSFPERLTFTVEEAAKALGIGRGLAYEGVRIGAIPSVRIGGRVLIPKSRLQALLDGESDGANTMTSESGTANASATSHR